MGKTWLKLGGSAKLVGAEENFSFKDEISAITEKLRETTERYTRAVTHIACLDVVGVRRRDYTRQVCLTLIARRIYIYIYMRRVTA